MSISVRNFPPIPSRPCDFSLALQDDSVFADFSVDEEGRAYLVRISFDGFGCNSGLETINRLDPLATSQLIEAIETAQLDRSEVQSLLLNYFSANRSLLWEDALSEHSLLPLA